MYSSAPDSFAPLPYKNNALRRGGVPRVNGNSIHFIKPTGPTIPETFNFAGVTSKETFLSPPLSTFASFNSPVCSDRPLPSTRGPAKAVMDEHRGNSEIERGEERRSPLPPLRKIYFKGARWMKSAFVSLLVIVFPSVSFGLLFFLCV